MHMLSMVSDTRGDVAAPRWMVGRLEKGNERVQLKGQPGGGGTEHQGRLAFGGGGGGRRTGPTG